MKKSKLVFVHIPQTAGMTLRHVVYRQFKRRKRYTFAGEDYASRLDFIKLPEQERHNLQLVAGFTHYGVHQYLSVDGSADNVRYMTMIRNPVERIISQYYRIVGNPDHHNYNSYRNLSVVEYAHLERKGEGQTRWLLGYRDDTDKPLDAYELDDTLPENALEIAKNRLKNDFDFVGIVEQFDVSILLMKQHYGWRNAYYAKRNINVHRPRRIATNTYEQLKAYVKTDMELYQFAVGLFEERLANYDGDMDVDLQRFRRRNALFSRVWYLREGIISRQTGMYDDRN